MNSLESIVRDARVVVCVGSGGVGKTTTSALIGLEAARQGRRALVMTIDPARRLANALGLERFDEQVHTVELPDNPLGGRLDATMLDMKKAFDDIVTRNAPNAATRDAILSNRFYRFFSTSLAGAQELSASEHLLELTQSGQYDLLVLDTPPTSNALDFLDAPMRYFDALDSTALQWAMQAGGKVARRGGALLNAGTQVVIKTLGRFTGTEFFAELGEFLFHFSTLFDGFRERTLATAKLFSDEKTRFVIVTSPDTLTVDEALYFRRRLDELGIRLGAVIANRVRPRLVNNSHIRGDARALADHLLEIDGATLHGRAVIERLAARLLANAREIDRLAQSDEVTLTRLAAAIGSAPVLRVPLYAADIHNLEGIERMRTDLFGGR